MARTPKHFTTKEDQDKLISMYQGGISSVNIAKEFSVTAPTVLAALRRLGVEIRDSREAGRVSYTPSTRRTVKVDEDEFRELFPTHSNVDLATHFGCSVDTIVDRAKRFGLVNTNKRVQTAKRKSSLERYGVEHHSRRGWAEGAEKILSDHKLLIDYITTNFEVKPTSLQLSHKLGCSQDFLNVRLHQLGGFELVERYISSPERELAELFESWGIPFVRNTRKVLGDGRELDFYFPEHGVAVEFNETYWHSAKFKDEKYHLNKTLDCERLGVRLVHVWEHLWTNPQRRVVYENMIRHALKLTEHRIGARKTRVEKRTAISMKPFFEENNIQGYRSAKDAYVLVDRKTGVDLMCYTTGYAHFGKGKYDLEIARGACRLGYSVSGGATKLWKYIVEDRPEVNSIVYYVDLNHYNGASVSGLPGAQHIKNQSGFWNWWEGEGVMKNREPHRHAEIVQGYKDGSVWQVHNSGTATYVWERS